MEVVEDIVVIGAGIADWESGAWCWNHQSLRVTVSHLLLGHCLEGRLIGIGDSLRRQHDLLNRIVATSAISGLPTLEMPFKSKSGDHEVRCVRRKLLLLEALEKEHPIGTIKYSSKVVSIEKSGCFKLVHVTDGSVLRAKVLIGCDEVNSVVAMWLGFKNAAFVGRSAIRGYADFIGSHGFGPTFLQFSGNGVRSGFLPCHDTTVYWFFTFTPPPKVRSPLQNSVWFSFCNTIFKKDKEVEENPVKMKEFAPSKLGNVPEQVKAVVEITELDSIICSPLRFRHPWELLWGNISKGSVCVAGDVLHSMTPGIGQGGCAALEGGGVLAQCLGKLLRKNAARQAKQMSIRGLRWG
ncbi:FAD/NAD(P)-binding oxidoreductase family protein [Actinidia rufa]|uniref:FAD/NAD(P)-binding oxidoreductase family protein n=1 Tax=Actinidia rufa TaxID=165716 RepID=A0A7J0ETM6_9ERIC|nr:FAD/NAD(P)-binding oxidoreductase family protein [Actinidia rufa]